jgi:hypothetical protein
MHRNGARRTEQVSGSVRDHGLSRAPESPNCPCLYQPRHAPDRGRRGKFARFQRSRGRKLPGFVRSVRAVWERGLERFFSVGVGVAGWTPEAFFFISELFSLDNFLKIYLIFLQFYTLTPLPLAARPLPRTALATGPA